MQFEWDMRKAVENVAKHGVPFDYAARVFLDPSRLDSESGDRGHTALLPRGVCEAALRGAGRRILRMGRPRPRVRREPLWIHRANGALLFFAGLFEAWQHQPGEWQTTFTIITTAANRALEPIHNRMPVILDEAGAADWMNAREPDPLSLKRLLRPAPDDLLVVRLASPLVISVKNEGPELLEDQSLFGYGARAGRPG
jgi:hypothetical protein